MLYKNDIANLALGHLGQAQHLLDLDVDNGIHAKVIRRYFRMSLDTMLGKHEWGFATQYAPLSLMDDSFPVFGYKYAYRLPADCHTLRVIAENGAFPHTKQYEFEKSKFKEVYSGTERVIYTNVPNAHGEYTTRISEDAPFPVHFGRGLSHLLALDIAPQLITNNFPKVKNELMTTSKNEVSAAIAEDIGRATQMEDSPTPFISCRMGQ